MLRVAMNSSKESKKEGIRDVLKSAPNAFPPKQTELSTSTCVWELGVASLGGAESISNIKFTIAATAGTFSDECVTSIIVLLASREIREEVIDMKTGIAMKTGTVMNDATIVMIMIRIHHQDHIEQKQQMRRAL